MKQIAIISGKGEISLLLKRIIKNSIIIKTPPLPNIDEIIKLLKDKGIEKVIFAGKFEKSLIYKTNQAFLKTDDAFIIKEIKDKFERKGIKVLNPKIWLSQYIAKEGLLGGPAPNNKELSDIKLGLKIAKILNRFGGQVVCIKDGIVIAMEGLDGTDEVIKRAGKIVDNFVVVKYGKRGMELPVIGEKTMRVMKKSGGRVLAIRKNIVIVLPKAIAFAEKNNISLVSI